MLRFKMKGFGFSSGRRVGFLSLISASLVMVGLVLSASLGIFSNSSYAQSTGDNPVLGANFTCTPIGVASFTNRVHVRCSAAAPGNIYWFAVSTKDSGMASRFLSIFTTAKVTGKNLSIFYDPADLSGGAWGCNTSDCRNITGAEVLN